MPDREGAAGAAAEEIHDDDMLSHPQDAGGNDEGVDAEGGGRQALSRDELYERLGAVDDPDQGEEPEEEAPDPQVGEADEAEDEQPEEDEQPPESDEDEATDEDEEPEEAPAEDDAPHTDEPDQKLLGRVPDDEWKKLPKVTRDRINALRADRKAIRSRVQELESRDGLASYAEQIIRFADENHLGDRDLQEWLEVGAVVQRGGEDAINELLSIARAFGWKPETAQPSSEALPDWLQAKVDAFEIDEEQARDIARRLPREQEAPEAPAQKERPRAPRFGPDDDALARGRQTLDTKIAEAQRRLGSSWAKIWPQVERRMLARKGAHPDSWGDIFDSAVEAAVARNKPARPKRAGRTGLGPTSKTHETVDPDTLTGRDRLYHKYTGRGT